MFTFLSPLFLIGLVSAAIPLLVHLSRSRRTKKIRFSTTQFFTDQFLQSYRMSRLKELLLLACRMALCALLAAALASPMLLPRAGSPLTAESRAVVLVLDNSASMGLDEEGQTLLERARSAAGDVLDSLRPGDSAGLVLAGRRSGGPELVFAEPTPQLGDVRQALDQVSLSSLGTDLSSAMARARSLLAKTRAESKEVYLFSDLQDSGWELADDPATESSSAEELVFIVRVRPQEPENLAVTAVEYAAARPMVGVPFAIKPHLRNDASQMRAAQVRLYVDGELVGQRELESLPAGRWTVTRFHHTFSKGGWHEGYVEIDDEALAADNRRYFAFEVIDTARVLAVNGAPSNIERLDELFYLEAALAAAGTSRPPIQVQKAAPAELAAADLSPYRAVILANVESLPGEGLERLEAFVDRGGSLLVFLGDQTNGKFFNQALAGPARLHGGLAPARLLNVERAAEGRDEIASVGRIDFAHPVLAAFADPQFANLAQVRFRGLWTLDPVQEAQVLLRADTGSPLLVEKRFGKGRVMLFASTCDRDWTNFPVRPAWLPWVYRVVGYLAQEPLAQIAFFNTGDAVPVPVSASEGISRVLVRLPDKSLEQAEPAGDPQSPLVFRGTERPGVYRLFAPGREASGHRFVANLESYESDLTYLDEVFARRGSEQGGSERAAIEAGFRELLAGAGQVAYVDRPERLGDASLRARRGVKLWDLVLLIALGVALFEPWLASRINQRHYARPQEIDIQPAARRGRIWPRANGRRLEPEMPAGSIAATRTPATVETP